MSKQTQIVGDFAYAMGVTDERERIIKLLEKQSFKTIHDEIGVSERLDVLIALIKGETNE